MHNMKEKTSKVTDSLIMGEVASEKELSIRNNEDITDAEIIEDDALVSNKNGRVKNLIK